MKIGEILVGDILVLPTEQTVLVKEIMLDSKVNRLIVVTLMDGRNVAKSFRKEQECKLIFRKCLTST